MRQVPDISEYEPYKVVEDVALEGTVVPGLTGHYFRRQESGRTATVGCYSYAGVELFFAWGYQDEAHCAWTAYRAGDGWTAPHQGCPRVTWTVGELLIDIGPATISLPLQREIAHA